MVKYTTLMTQTTITNQFGIKAARRKFGTVDAGSVIVDMAQKVGCDRGIKHHNTTASTRFVDQLTHRAYCACNASRVRRGEPRQARGGGSVSCPAMMCRCSSDV